MVAIQELHNIASGPLFILGCGPSLIEQLPLLEQLNSHATFCCNRMSYWAELPFEPTYYSCSTPTVVKGVEPSDPPFRKYKFLFSRKVDSLPGWVSVRKKPYAEVAGLGDSIDLVKTGWSSPFLMAQVAAWMGYRRLYFLGVDGKNGGHCYDPDGTWLPFSYRLGTEEFQRGWQLLIDALEPECSLVDCTPGGVLNEVLGYTPLEEILANE